MCQAKVNLPASGGIVEATGWLKMRAGARKGADARTVTEGLDLAKRRENRGNLGRVIPWTCKRPLTPPGCRFFEPVAGSGLFSQPPSLLQPSLKNGNELEVAFS